MYIASSLIHGKTAAENIIVSYVFSDRDSTSARFGMGEGKTITTFMKNSTLVKVVELHNMTIDRRKRFFICLYGRTKYEISEILFTTKNVDNQLQTLIIVIVINTNARCSSATYSANLLSSSNVA